MNQLRLLVLLFVVLGIIIFAQSSQVKSQTAQKETLGEQTKVTPLPSSINHPSPTTASAHVLYASPTDTPVPPTSAPQPSTSSNANSSYIYPNAHQTSSNAGKIFLESSDSTDAITDWYKNLIQSQNMNINTFVKQNSNGNVNNVLSGANGNSSIKVTITKNASDANAEIMVDVK